MALPWGAGAICCRSCLPCEKTEIEMLIRPAVPDDHDAIRALLTGAFPDPSEARLVDDLRAAGDLIAEIVAEDAGTIVGHVAFSRHPAPEGWVCLAPLAVAEPARRQGVGGALVRDGLDRMRQAGIAAVTVLGDAAFYQRFGFTRAAAGNLDTPYPPEHMLVYPIAAGVSGTQARLVWPVAFDAV